MHWIDIDVMSMFFHLKIDMFCTHGPTPIPPQLWGFSLHQLAHVGISPSINLNNYNIAY